MTKMGRTPPQHAVARPGKATGKSVAATGTSTATQGRVQATHVQQEANFTADDELLFLLEEVTRGVRRAFERRIGAFGLSRAQWRLLGSCRGLCFVNSMKSPCPLCFARHSR